MVESESKSPIVAILQVEMPLEEAQHLLSDTVSSEKFAEEGQPIKSEFSLLAGDAFRIGRDPAGNDLALSSSCVSRFHAVFTASYSSVVLSDLSSTNGTFVDGRRITTPVALAPGQKIEIGESTITVNLIVAGCPLEVDLEHTRVSGMKRELVTLLVADICGYSNLTKSLPSDQVARMLSLWLEKTSDLTKKHQGQVDKFIGDCVMALWHASDKGAEEVALQAMQAAIEIMKATNSMSEGPAWDFHHDYPWRCRLSLNTGLTLMGAIGGGGSRDFTVLGDTVNVAFGLNHACKDLDQSILLSASTAELVKAHYSLQDLGEIEVKGHQKLPAFGLEGSG